MSSTLKRFLSLMLAFIMVLSIAPVSAEDSNGVVVVETDYVAKIGDTPYVTLQAAFEAAVDGDTIVLLKDADGKVQLSVSDDNTVPSVTLNLNGHTWDCGYGTRINAVDLTVRNGTIGTKRSEVKSGDSIDVFYFGGHSLLPSKMDIKDVTFNAELRVNNMAPSDEELGLLATSRSVGKAFNATEVTIWNGQYDVVTVQKGAYLTLEGGWFSGINAEEGATVYDHRKGDSSDETEENTEVVKPKIVTIMAPTEFGYTRTERGVTVTFTDPTSIDTRGYMQFTVGENSTVFTVQRLDGETWTTVTPESGTSTIKHPFAEPGSVTFRLDWDGNGTYDRLIVLVKGELYEVATKDELKNAVANAQDGATIRLTADIDYGTDQLKIETPITLDLGGFTLTTRNAWGGMSLKNNPTIKNGTIVHASNTAAIKAWNVESFEDLVIDVQGKGDANKTIGGIVVQSGTEVHIGSIKNVTIKGDALTNGIETYNCGDANTLVIGNMENVTIDAAGTGMLISAPCGTATNCDIKGGVSGIEIWIKGNYSAWLQLVNSDVYGGTQAVYVHDEFNSAEGIVNSGSIMLLADAATEFTTSETGVLLNKVIARIDEETQLTLPMAVTFEIWDVDDLETFRSMVNDYGITFDGETVKLMDDINLAGINWTPIGNTTNYFWGTFDGGNHTISNMMIDVNTPDTDQFLGLFGGIKNAVIKNLTMENVSITAVGKKVRAAAVVGIADSDKATPSIVDLAFQNITVSGCTIDVEAASSTALVGGVVGYSYPANMSGINVSDLTIDAKASDSQEVRAAAINGYVCGQNISNNGNTRMAFTAEDFNVSDVSIKASAGTVFAGGYAPYTYYGYITLKDGNINGLKIDVDATSAFVGGLVGYFWRSDTGHTVEDVKITGIDFDVTTDYLGETRVGGMVGTSQSVVSYKDCSVVGTITESCSDSANPVNYHAKVGGFVGRAYTWGQTYTNCTADVDVTGSHVAGGFVGNHITSASYTNCKAMGDVTANIAGGFVGRLTEHSYSSAVTFDGCTVSGNVTGTNVAGGFIGSTADHGWTAWVAGNGTGYNKDITIKNSTITGEVVSGTAYQAGVVGELKLGESGSFNMEENVSYVVEPPYYPCEVAQIGEDKFFSLQEAVDAAEPDAIITIIAEHELTEPVVIEKNVTIDLGGMTVTGKDVYPMIRVQGGAEVTVKNGTMTNDDYVFVLGASDGSSAGYLTIESGSYTGDTTMASVTKGTLTITGGSFKVTDSGYGMDYLLNCIDANYIDGSAAIVVTGGTFYGFDPANNAAEGVETNFVDPAYAVTDNGDGSFTVGEWSYEIYTWDDLKRLDAIVEGGNTLKDKTVKLMNDIDLSEVDENGERVTFDPIGDNSHAFEGTFDGGSNKISNMYQNGWALGYEWGVYGSIGLFANINDATIKNLTITGAECLVEGGDVGGITGSATGTCVFENITITDSTFATYNNGCGGIIAWSGDGNYTFKNINITSSVTLAGLWGSFDSSIGGVVGQGEPGATYTFENVDIACRLDVYNDCTASYDYYNYRMSGMIIGRLQECTTIDGKTVPDTSKYGITCTDVTVTYGSWANYHYCDPTTSGYNNGRGMRVEAGYAYDGLPADYDHSTCTSHCKAAIPFDQLFGGKQYGADGLPTYEGVTVIYGYVAQIDEDGYWTLADAVAAAEEDDTIVLLKNVTITDTVTVDADDVITLDLAGYTITGTPAEAAAYAVITNKGNLTITGEGAIVCDHQLAGSTSYAVNTILNAGTLNLDGEFTVENKSTASNQIGYAIDNNSTSGAPTVEVNGATIKVSGSNYYDGIRLFCNSETNANSVTVNSGSVSSIWLQNPSDGTERNTKDVVGSVTITGGTVANLYLEPSAAFTASITGGHVNSISAFETSEGRDLTAFIADTDATFGMDVEEAGFVAEGYIAKANEDNTIWTVIEGEWVVAIGDVKYASIQEAIDAAEGGETITVLVGHELTAPVVNTKQVTIDLGGNTVSYSTTVAGEAMITNKGNLTLTGEGKIDFTYTGAADTAYTKGNYTISNGGTLTVSGPSIVNSTAKMSHACYAIDNNSINSAATLTIDDGEVINDGNYAIRQIAGSNANTVTVNGGKVKGTRAVWIQLAGSDTSVAPSVTLNVTGGTLTGTGESADYKLAVYSYSYGYSMANTKINITGGTLDGDVALTGGKNKTAVETVTVTGGTITDLYSYGADELAVEAISITGGTFGSNYAEMYSLDDGCIFRLNEDDAYDVVAGEYVAQVGDVKYATLQEAVDAAVNGDTVVMLTGITEDVTVEQKDGVKITIEGNDNTLTGTITVNGKSKRYETAALTIQNVNFSADTLTAGAFIYLGKSGDNNTRYTNNVTISGCTFTDTDGGNNIAGIKQYTGGCTNLTVTGCKADNLHSLIQLANVESGLVISDCTVEGCKNGISLGNSNGATISGCTIEATGYGIRADGDVAAELTVSGCTITAEMPIVVRKMTEAYELNVTGENTLTASNTEGYQIIFTNDDDGTYVDPTGAFVYNAEAEYKVFPMAAYVAEVVETGKAYMTLKEALEACTAGETVKLIADIVYDADDVVYAHGGATGFGNYDAYNPSIVYIGGTRVDGVNSPSNVNAVLDLNGHSIINNAAAYTFMIMDNAKVTFTDSVGTGFVTNTADAPVIWSTGTDTVVTINGGKYVADNYGSLLWATHSGDLVINGGEFKTTAEDASCLIMRNEKDRQNSAYFIKGKSTIKITGGTFDYDPEATLDDSTSPYTAFNAVAEGYIARKVGDVWTVVVGEWVAQVGETKYETFDAAVEAANAGDVKEIVLLRDIVISEDKEYDLTGLTVTTDGDVYPAFRIQDGANVTITGGTITNNDYVFVLGASDGSSAGYLTISGGTYTGDTTMASVTKGTLTVTGGEFKVTDSGYGTGYLLNCIDANYADGSAKIVVTGGTFHGFNPEANAAEGADTNFLASEKYIAIEESENVFVVWDYVEWLKAELLAGRDVKLERDIVVDGSYIDSIPAAVNSNGKYLNPGIFNAVGVNVKFDLNGHNITYNGHESFTWNGKTYNSCTVAHGLFFANAGANLEICDTVGDSLITVYGMASGVYAASPNSVINVTGGSWVNKGCATCSGTNLFLYVSHGGQLVINAGNFTQDLDSNGDSYLIVNHNGEYKNSVIDYSLSDITIYGGTFTGMNPEEAHFFRQTADNKLVLGETYDATAEGYIARKTGDNTWTVVVGKWVAQVGETKYETLTEAVKAALEPDNTDPVVVLTNITEDTTYLGQSIAIPVIGDLTVDLAGYTVDFNGFFIVNGTVEIKNGTLNGTNTKWSTVQTWTATSSDDDKIAALLLLYGQYIGEVDLTLTDVDVTGVRHALRAEGGNVTVNGGSFTAKASGLTNYGINVGGDADSDVVINDAVVKGESNNGGNAIAVKAGSSLTIYDGNYSSNQTTVASVNGTMVLYGGTYTEDVQQYCAEGYKAVDNEDGTWTVKPLITVTFDDVTVVDGNEMPEFTYTTDFAEVAEDGTMLVVETPEVTVEGVGEYEITANAYVFMSDAYAIEVVPGTLTVLEAVAQIGETKYATLTDAIEAAEAGDTIVFLANITEDVTVNKSVTIDGAEFEYTGNISVTGTTSAVTVKNVNFVDGTYYAITTNRIKSITVESCTVSNYDWGFLYANKSTPTVVVKDVTVDGTNYGIHWVYGTTATLEDVVMTNVAYGIMTQNYGAKTINMVNCNISATNAIYVWAKSTSTDTFIFEGTGNTLTGAVATNDYGTLKLADVDSTLTAPEGLTVITDAEGYEVEYTDGVYHVVPIVRVAAIGETQYKTLAAAIEAAEAGDTIVFLTDIEEDVTVTKNVTIDGADYKYTGTMTLNKVSVTIENVNVVKGTIYKHKSTGVGGDITIRNCTFDGQGLNTYAVNLGGTGSIVIEDVTAKGYGYGFLQVPASNTSVSVKDVEISEVNYGFKIDYSGGVTIEDVKVDAAVAGLLNSNYGAKTLTIKNSELSIYGTWTRNDTTKTTVVFEGENTVGEFIHDVDLDTLKLADVDSTLTAPEGLTVITDAEGYEVEYTDGVYHVVPIVRVAAIGETQYKTIQKAVDAAEDGDTIVLLKDINIAEVEYSKLDGSYNSVAVIDGKTVTIDMAGYAITGEYTDTETMLVGIFSTDNGGHLTLTNGNINVTATGEMVYSLIANYEPGCSITIENGTYKLDKAIDSLLYTGGDEGIIVNGGIFTLGNVGTGSNGKPWIFNAKGQNTASVIVNDGTFNADVNHQYWAHEVEVPETKALKDNGDGTWTVVDAAAYVIETAHNYKRNVGYATLAEAINVAENKSYVAEPATITLVAANAEDVEISKNITLNLGEYAYTGTATLTDVAATLTAVENLTVITNVEDHKVVYEEGMYKVVPMVFVAQIGTDGEKFETVAEAIAAAEAGDTIYLLDNVTEDVTVNKSVTIDGAEFEYTGNISVTGTTSAVTVKNVNFVDGTYYAITTNRIKSITVESCTVSNYDWGFLYANKSTPTVVVKDVTVDGTNYGIHWVYGTTATLEDVVMTNVAYGIMTQNYGAKTINMVNCNISATNAIYVWAKSTKTDTYIFEGTGNVLTGTVATNDYGTLKLADVDSTLTAPEGLTVITDAEGYEVEYTDGVYRVVPIVRVAAIGETQYKTIQAAVDAAEDGETITIIADVEDESVIVNKTVTIDLNGRNISSTGDMFEVVSGGNLTINGEGTVAGGTAGAGSWTAVWANGGNVTITSGTYTVGGDSTTTDTTHQNDVIYTKNGGTVSITGGTFLNNGTVWTLNQNDSTGGAITVTGGTFYNFNPEDNVSEGANTNFVAEGYRAVETETNVWKVVEQIDVTVSIDSVEMNFSDEMPEFTYTAVTADGTDVTDKVTIGSFIVNNGEAIEVAGTYAITAEDVEAEAPYTVTVVNDGTLTVAAQIINRGMSLVLTEQVHIKQYIAFVGFDLTKEEILENGGVEITALDTKGNEKTYTLKLTDAGIHKDGTQEFAVATDGIPVAQLGDVITFRPFVTVDGETVYGDEWQDSARMYAERKFETSDNENLKSMLAALMNYGAAAQKYFKYRTDDLMNSSLQSFVDAGSLKAEYLNLNWSNDYLTDVVDPTEDMTVNFAATGTLTDDGKSLNLRGALYISYYYNIDTTQMDAFANATDKTFYVWTVDRYNELKNANTPLTKDNASYTVTAAFNATYGEFSAKSGNFYSTMYGDALYTALCVTDANGVEHCSGVTVYSPETYAATKLSDGTSAQIDNVVQWMVVYGERAKVYFDK